MADVGDMIRELRAQGMSPDAVAEYLAREFGWTPEAASEAVGAALGEPFHDVELDGVEPESELLDG